MPENCLLRSGDFHHCSEGEDVVFEKNVNMSACDGRIDANGFERRFAKMDVALNVENSLSPSSAWFNMRPKVSEHFVVFDDMFDDLNKLSCILHRIEANEHAGVDALLVGEVDVLNLWLDEEVKDHSLQEG